MLSEKIKGTWDTINWYLKYQTDFTFGGMHKLTWCTLDEKYNDHNSLVSSSPIKYIIQVLYNWCTVIVRATFRPLHDIRVFQIIVSYQYNVVSGYNT